MVASNSIPDTSQYRITGHYFWGAPSPIFLIYLQIVGPTFFLALELWRPRTTLASPFSSFWFRFLYLSMSPAQNVSKKQSNQIAFVYLYLILFISLLPSTFSYYFSPSFASLATRLSPYRPPVTVARAYQKGRTKRFNLLLPTRTKQFLL